MPRTGHNPLPTQSECEHLAALAGYMRERELEFFLEVVEGKASLFAACGQCATNQLLSVELTSATI